MYAAKYKNKKVVNKEGTFDSQKEFRRYCELIIQEENGLIKNLRRQVKYQLIPNQKDENGKVIERAINYIADFVYEDSSGATVVEDTKGYRTQDYILKRKMMLHFHDIRIKEL